MASPTLVAAPVCIAVATAALWLLGRRFEGYFDDRRLFFSLVVGFFAGLLVAFLEVVLFRFHDPGFLLQAAFGGLLLGLGYGLLESLAKLVVLGSKGYRVRKDTPFYGAALGIGFGATLSLQYLAAHILHHRAQADAWGPAFLRAATMASLLAWGIVLGNAGVGVLLGKAASDGRLKRAILTGTLAQAPLPLLLGLYGAGLHLRTPGWQLGILATVAFVYGAGAFVLAVRALDRVVPPEIRDIVRRDRRRKARQAGRQV